MDLIKLERALNNHGFMVSRYLAPAGGLTLSHPALSGVVDVAITQLGERCRVCISASTKDKWISLIAPIKDMNGEEVIEQVIEQVESLLKK
jgi:hypothetical protein